MTDPSPPSISSPPRIKAVLIRDPTTKVHQISHDGGTGILEELMPYARGEKEEDDTHLVATKKDGKTVVLWVGEGFTGRETATERMKNLSFADILDLGKWRRDLEEDVRLGETWEGWEAVEEEMGEDGRMCRFM